ncbi:MAG: DUF4215 domain-containing protein [Kofleriaceae bacterium]
MRSRVGLASAVLLAASALAGCLVDSTLVCEDGSVCGPDQSCAPNGGCAPIVLVLSCRGVDDGFPCTYLAGGNGICLGQVCAQAGCGNGFLEPDLGEVCDDGNQLSGDGCNATCSSTGLCGNGQLDPLEECDCGDGAGDLPLGCVAPNGLSTEATCSPACVQLRCGNGVVDPREACDDGNFFDGDGCSSDCRSDESCGNGIRDLTEACDDGNLISGDGCQAWCELPSCGDAVVDAGEICDDGNLISGDGCASDCHSDETCGNGVADFLVGEQCDDGDLRSQDGCSSGCLVESWRFTANTEARPEFSAAAPSMVYDAARGVTLLYLSDSQSTSETWTFDGVGWRLEHPATTPPPRSRPGLAYDAAREEVVMFGGYNGYSLRETWTWDGTTWTQRLIAPASSPPNPGYTLMTYDAAHEQTLLFTGGSWGEVAQLWAWDGEAWTRLATGGPPGAYPDGFAYDPVRGRAYLHCGYSNTTANPVRTWAWDGAAWSNVSAATGPASGSDMRAVFDATIGESVLTRYTTYPTLTQQTWSWNGTRWLNRGVPTSPPYRPAALAHDYRRGRTVVLPSYTGASTEPPTWEFDGTAWTAFAPTPMQVYDRVHLVTLPWESSVYGLANNGVFVWSGRGWHRISPATLSSYDPALVADPGGQRLLAVSDYAGETYQFVGGTWTTVVQPDYDLHLGYGSAVAVDTARDEIILLGGNQTDGTTYRLDGNAWTAVADPAHSPPPRFRASMGYDPVRERVVLFGGYRTTTSEALDDTWEWDGATWLEHTPTTRPLPRVDATLLFDPLAEDMVMIGGASETVLWRWDGVDWRSQIVVGATSFSGVSAAHDPNQRQFVTATYSFLDNKVITNTIRLESASADEICLGDLIDGDHDGLPGCDDPDCRGQCAPMCVGDTDCATTTPRCGDGTCGGAEHCGICPEDCGACPDSCGDAFCTGAETQGSCPGDCTP